MFFDINIIKIAKNKIFSMDKYILAGILGMLFERK